MERLPVHRPIHEPVYRPAGRILAPVFAVACSILSLTLAEPAVAASFDCERGDLAQDEKAICDNRVLNDADVRMVTTFDILSGLVAMGARGEMQDQQTLWLKERQACAADVACIQGAYDRRMQQLDEAYKNISRPF
ncbi:uncharacterized protein GGQ64_002612 [Rhizobium azooxidifex]|uniref:Lysozyme inhibitor LprI N-terminal domain-containing protein n=1 Tax=Mycoplana azooxidifex TaxID=1636188 RepID=A0A7W6D601_9HYPH|nr:hypothetical protein [Mycoplana azooxidifex]MBB3977406.1 uncharacterized protein [Mycoplana azooxidifex]